MLTSTLSVLVVDDDPDCAYTTAALLRRLGHAANVALSGAEALRLATDLAPDVVLLDLAMPGMDGYALAEGLRLVCVGKQPFLVAVSGYCRDEDRLKASRAGIDLFLVKPVAPADLFRLLDCCAEDADADRPAIEA